ncbi:hypothetical protein ceV_480 [Chrysochromulina ericina virus CeV-01B]|uniref:Uncharacterized protein n=1 Tax=Chrysochromulina ericina virus CeV-01B TaxID=3070830 RepID=A0A0N9R4D2_9VIRU|nr:hypothetical protein ceV_480 [Chrysochromulina ericina virus]ALH23386.1 hypothetical protein ceV_480 [Chrysochromulina ericina virus CeV-01B]
MNNFNKLNLDITKYSNLELKEILGLNDVTDNGQIQKHLSNIELKVSDDVNMSFSDKNRMLTFLHQAKNKLDETTNMVNNNLNKRYSANTSYLVPDTPDDNPVIRNPNTLLGSKVKVYKGRGSDEYPPGYLNPINTKIIQKTINIDSRFRDQYYNSKSSDFHIDLPETFRKVVHLSLTSYELPISIYGINSCNNHFIIQSKTNRYNIDISNGNYFTPFSSRIFSFDASSNILNKVNKSLNNVGLSDISYNIDQVNGKSYFTTTTNNNYEIFFNRDICGNDDLQTPLPLKLGWNLGFRVGHYYLAKGNKVWSEATVNLDTPKYLYICIDDFTNAGNNGFVATFSDSTLSKNIITRINYSQALQVDGVYNRGFDNVVFNSDRFYHGPVDIKKLRITILDEYGRVVDLNNMDWSFTLNLDILYN